MILLVVYCLARHSESVTPFPPVLTRRLRLCRATFRRVSTRRLIQRYVDASFDELPLAIS